MRLSGAEGLSNGRNLRKVAAGKSSGHDCHASLRQEKEISRGGGHFWREGSHVIGTTRFPMQAPDAQNLRECEECCLVALTELVNTAHVLELEVLDSLPEYFKDVALANYEAKVRKNKRQRSAYKTTHQSSCQSDTPESDVLRSLRDLDIIPRG